MKRTIATLCLLASVAGCAPGERDQTAVASPYSTENLNAVLWVQTAAEYEVAARQAYGLAAAQLLTGLADVSTSALTEQAGADFAELPPAVILDVDETVLDNSPAQARQILDDQDFNTDAWHAWVREERATAVPGALAFTQLAASEGVRVFYVTNRRHVVEDATRRNLEALGFPLEEGVDTLLTRDERPDWGSDKGTRRAHVAAGHRVVLQVGDNLGDFVSGIDVDPVARQGLVQHHADRWGRQWIMLPNPQYGSWDGALIGFDFGLDRQARRERRLGALRTARENNDE